MLGGKYAARATLELQRRADAAADSFAVDPAARTGPGRKKLAAKFSKAQAREKAKERAARKKMVDARIAAARAEATEQAPAAAANLDDASSSEGPLDSDDDAATV